MRISGYEDCDFEMPFLPLSDEEIDILLSRHEGRREKQEIASYVFGENVPDECRLSYEIRTIQESICIVARFDQGNILYKRNMHGIQGPEQKLFEEKESRDYFKHELDVVKANMNRIWDMLHGKEIEYVSEPESVPDKKTISRRHKKNTIPRRRSIYAS